MAYRTWLLGTSGLGALAALVFLVLFVVIDRPRYRDRYAGLIAGLGVLAFLGFAIPFTLALLTPTPTVTAARSWWQWAISIVLRGATVGWMGWLLFIYLTPGRAKLRLTRRDPEDTPH
jgi:hypothetical protein